MSYRCASGRRRERHFALGGSFARSRPVSESVQKPYTQYARGALAFWGGPIRQASPAILSVRLLNRFPAGVPGGRLVLKRSIAILLGRITILLGHITILLGRITILLGPSAEAFRRSD